MKFERRAVKFFSKDSLCKGWLYVPQEEKRFPIIIMAHGIGLTKESGLEPYAEKFANSGFAVLLFDYRFFGESDGEPRQLFSVKYQLQDWAAAIEYAKTLDYINPEKIALWGTSFSGGHVVVTAARHPEIAAISAQCPMMDAFASLIMFVKSAGVFNFFKLGFLGMIDQVKGLFKLTPVYVPVGGEPGKLAVMAAEDVVPALKKLTSKTWKNQLGARYALWIGAYRPIAHAGKVKCKALIQVCLRDKLVSPEAAMKTAKKMGSSAILQEFDCGHFDIYTGELFAKGSDKQLDFFEEVLK